MIRSLIVVAAAFAIASEAFAPSVPVPATRRSHGSFVGRPVQVQHVTTTTAAASSSALSMKYTLVLVRHGESTWNKENLFTGWADVPLSEEGLEEAHAGGVLLREAGFDFDVAYTSTLKRAIKTLWIILEEMGESHVVCTIYMYIYHVLSCPTRYGHIYLILWRLQRVPLT